MLFIDLDDFQPINDGIGHAAGDKLLVAAAGALVECVREGDTAARLGGDEFPALLEQPVSPPEAQEIAPRILAGWPSRSNLSGGIAASAPSPSESRSPTGRSSAEDLLRHADPAMYTAKAQGKARVAVYDSPPSTPFEQAESEPRG